MPATPSVDAGRSAPTLANESNSVPAGHSGLNPFSGFGVVQPQSAHPRTPEADSGDWAPSLLVLVLGLAMAVSWFRKLWR